MTKNRKLRKFLWVFGSLNIYILRCFTVQLKAWQVAKVGMVTGVRVDKAGPLERAILGHQIEGFKIPDRREAGRKKKT